MEKSNLIFSKIGVRGLVLVLVPLFFQTASVLMLCWLQAHYESILLHEKKVKAVIFYANDFWMESTSLITHALQSRISKAKTVAGQKEGSLAAIDRNTQLIIAAIGSDNIKMSRLRSMLKTSRQMRRIAASMVESAPLSTSGMQQMLVLKEDIQRIKKMQTLTQNLNAAVRHFKEPLEQEAKQSKAAVLSTRSYLRLALALTCFADVTIAAVLLFYFMRTIYSGIKVLHANTLRLANTQELLPELNTGDELAELDRTFHQMARSLATARRRELATINNSADMICVLDAEMRFNLVNPAAERLLGFSTTALLGHESGDYCVDLDKTMFISALAECKTSGETSEFECRLQTHSNTVIHTLWRVNWSALEHEYFCVVHDISEIKKLEELKQVFVATVSHELRTPLTSIQFFLSNLSSGVLGRLEGNLADDVVSAEVEAAKLIKLISEFLDLEKLEAGKMPFRPRMIYVETAVEDAAELLRTRQPSPVPELEVNETDFEIWADPDLIMQGLGHLIMKAATDFSASLIKISAQELATGIEIRLTFSCDSEAPVEVIFDRSALLSESHSPGAPAARRHLKSGSAGYQPASNVRPQSGFSGLSLPICKQIIKLHGGSIGFQQQNGQCCFYFDLPFPHV